MPSSKHLAIASSPSRIASALTVGQVAREAGVGIETVRFYEREGLLPAPPRTPSGYRQYTPATVEQLQFIQRAKELGFSLRETQELLALRSDDSATPADAHARAAAKVEEISAKIRDLETMRAQLSTLLVRCARRESDAACPILVALDRRGAAS